MWFSGRSPNSPIFSPDLEKGRGSLDFPLIVRDAPDEIPRSALASKPSLSPESRDSPRILARQEMTSPDRGGLSDSASRHKSAFPGKRSFAESFFSFTTSRLIPVHGENSNRISAGSKKRFTCLIWLLPLPHPLESQVQNPQGPSLLSGEERCGESSDPP